MIPRQLGMQRNAAMYSNANVWMQTFDCCCMQVISSPQTSSREVAVAVAGVGELAPPTRRFFGQQVLAA